MAEGHRPEKRLSKAERNALREIERVNGGLPPSEVAVPVEAPVSESVIEQTPVVEETPAQSAAAEPAAESAPQEPAPT